MIFYIYFPRINKHKYGNTTQNAHLIEILAKSSGHGRKETFRIIVEKHIFSSIYMLKVLEYMRVFVCLFINCFMAHQQLMITQRA